MKRTDAFWGGFVMSMAMGSLVQDFHGQQGMIELCQHHWVSAWISAPVAIVGVVVAVAGYITARRADNP